MADDALFTIAGQEFKVTSPDRVLYPAAGTTKLEVIRYYAEASAAMLPQVCEGWSRSALLSGLDLRRGLMMVESALRDSFRRVVAESFGRFDSRVPTTVMSEKVPDVMFPSEWVTGAVGYRESEDAAAQVRACLDAGPVLLLPSWELEQSPGRRQHRLRSSYERTLLRLESPADGVLGVVLPAAMLTGVSSANLRAHLASAWSPRVVVHAGGSVVEGVHAAFRLVFLLCTAPSDDAVPVRVFDMTSRVDPRDLDRDFGELLRRDGGRTRYGYVLREGFPPGEPWGFDRHDPQVLRQKAELDQFGELRPLGELFTILRADPRPADGPGDGTARVVSARDISIGGDIDVDVPMQPSGRVSRTVALQAGDIVLAEIYTTRARLALVEPRHLPLEAGRGVLVLRPLQPVDVIDVELLRSLLNSTIGRRLIASLSSSNLDGALRLGGAGLRQLPVPQADADLKDAVATIADSQLALKNWQSDGDGLLTHVFDAPSAADARRSIIVRSRQLRARVEAAGLLDDPGYTVRTTFPYPVAYRWRTVEAHRLGSDPSKLLDAALACFETLLAYCAQLALVMARTADVDLGGYAVLRKKLAGGGVGTALGDWIRILDEVASSKKLRSLPQDHPLGELRSFLKSSDQDVVTSARINLTARRNDDAHSRRPTSAAAVREAAEQSLADIEVLLAAAAFLTDLPLLHITDNEWDSLTSRGVAEMRILKGDHPVAPYQRRAHDLAGLEKGSLYVQDTLGSLHLLRPFLVGTECPRCEVFSVFHVDYRSHDGTVMIKSLENGHTTRASDEHVLALRTIGYF